MDIKENLKIEINSLEQQYNELMKSATQNVVTNNVWEKEGDMYRLFNLHDTSKYDTVLSSNVQF
ncbi:hypothetical protein [Phocaeicola sartorii]|jgi:hypothetical protein|uniref:hypothetical protein n=1 Tax=Phocaeicola sartorii TaxID=671267 RepID=UPI00266F4C0F|nr:hypothetical protein [Phocaeicola sartorii]